MTDAVRVLTPPSGRGEASVAIRLALAQMRVIPGERDQNLAVACDQIEEARRRNADLVVLPESLDLGWGYRDARRLSERIPEGHACRRLAAAAARARIHVCAGLTESADGYTYNSAVLIDPDGKLLLVHRKINELPLARAVYDVGDRLGVANTSFGRIGVLICADALTADASLMTGLSLMGSRLIVSPCAWADEPGRDLVAMPYGDLWRAVYRQVSERYAVPVAAVSNVGAVAADAWQHRLCIGNSLVFDARGTEVLTGTYGADAHELLVVDLTLPERAAG